MRLLLQRWSQTIRHGSRNALGIVRLRSFPGRLSGSESRSHWRPVTVWSTCAAVIAASLASVQRPEWRPWLCYAEASTSLESTHNFTAATEKVAPLSDAAEPATILWKQLPDSLAELRKADIVLYQYETCPFCNKLRAYLDYWRIPYKVVEVNPVGKKELKFSSYRKVPILVVNGTQLNDSAAIIKALARITDPDRALNTQWFDWIDSWFVHTLPPNIYRTRHEALETFDYITEKEKFSPWQRFTIRYVGAAAMYFVSRRLKKKYHIVDERQALYDACRDWLQAVGWPERRFLGGARPCAADLAMFGVLRSIEGFTAFHELAANVPEIVQWYRIMKDQVGPSARIDSM
jgi:microsomal prostaglandin-E synthase 2